MSWFWGVDVGSHAISIAGLHDTGQVWWRTIELEHRKHRGAKRLAILRSALLTWAIPAAVQTPPDAVLVELPTGRHPNPSLMMSAGVAMEAVYAATGAPIIELPPTTWKRDAGLGGNATKDEVLAFAMAELGYKGAVQDEADALVMAFVSRQRFTT